MRDIPLPAQGRFLASPGGRAGLAFLKPFCPHSGRGTSCGSRGRPRFGVFSQSPSALSFQRLPRERDGNPRERQPRREDDCHGSQPVSTLPPPRWLLRPPGSGTFPPATFSRGLCSLLPSDTCLRSPPDKAENSRQGLGQSKANAGLWQRGLWESVVRGCRRVLGCLPTASLLLLGCCW